MDGVDGAVVITDGEDLLEFGAKGFVGFDEGERAILASALGRWGDDVPKSAREVIDRRHRTLCQQFEGVELIGFHGQTTAHDPDGGRTCQIGDGAALALASGVPVVWDFRSADMDAGGQGAPLAPFFHHALVRRAGLTDPVAVVNIGGVANASWVDPGVPRPEASGAVSGFDCGPGNALIDDFVRDRTGQSYDEGGAMALRGTPDRDLVNRVLERPYFAQRGPKSLDRGAFDDLHAGLAALSIEDGAASLAWLTAEAIARSAALMPARPARWYVCGGGRHNDAIMGFLTDLADAPVSPIESIGYDGDALEAQAFAWLAVRVLRGLPTSGPSTTGAGRPVCGGRIARPDR